MPFLMATIFVMTSTDPQRRWFHLTQGKMLAVLLVFEGSLLLADGLRWTPKGWAVLIAVAAIGLFLIQMLLGFLVAFLFHRRFQFSICSLLVLTLAVAIPFSWLAMAMREAKRQRVEAAAIRPPGYVVYDWQTDCDGQLTGEPKEPAWLLNWFGVDFFYEITDANE
jgi:hypothetical protein